MHGEAVSLQDGYMQQYRAIINASERQRLNYGTSNGLQVGAHAPITCSTRVASRSCPHSLGFPPLLSIYSPPLVPQLFASLRAFLGGAAWEARGRGTHGTQYGATSPLAEAVAQQALALLAPTKERPWRCRPLVFANTEEEKAHLIGVLRAHGLDAISWKEVQQAKLRGNSHAPTPSSATSATSAASAASASAAAASPAEQHSRRVIVANKQTEGAGSNMQHDADAIICRPTAGDHLEQMKGRVDRPNQAAKQLVLIIVYAANTIEEAEFANIRLAGNFFRQASEFRLHNALLSPPQVSHHAPPLVQFPSPCLPARPRPFLVLFLATLFLSASARLQYIAPVARRYREYKEAVDLEAVRAAGGQKRLKKGAVREAWMSCLESTSANLAAATEEEEDDDGEDDGSEGGGDSGAIGGGGGECGGGGGGVGGGSGGGGDDDDGDVTLGDLLGEDFEDEDGEAEEAQRASGSGKRARGMDGTQKPAAASKRSKAKAESEVGSSPVVAGEAKFVPVNTSKRNRGDPQAVRAAKLAAREGKASAAVRSWLFPFTALPFSFTDPRLSIHRCAAGSFRARRSARLAAQNRGRRSPNSRTPRRLSCSTARPSKRPSHTSLGEGA